VKAYDDLLDIPDNADPPEVMDDKSGKYEEAESKPVQPIKPRKRK